MINEKVIGLVDNEVIKQAEVQTSALKLKGDSQDIEVDATYDSSFSDKTSLLIISDNTNEASAIISIHNAAGTATLTKLAGSANIGIVKDAASKLNVYVEGGVIVVQNKLAALANVTVKEYK